MLFAGGKRLLYLYVVVLLVTPVLHMCHTCKVGAIRVFPGNAVGNVEFSHGNMDNKSKEDLYHKYFSGRTLGPSNTTQKGFDESKRRVPSCPDPLHN
ncbi:CLAVATA3/ESR (CLE)-related protein 27 [Abrus precatorius]|uniref:CLAVATA3/ESR (CLE)-related protein 27 n=1 Tax=Abrus precatorius TaxID=3816 RepID=A0A8B8MF49_ABRPR|nr:CLAVATA3/ESR (CLE)-related protein 27 [Abrus precatorius]